MTIRTLLLFLTTRLAGAYHFSALSFPHTTPVAFRLCHSRYQRAALRMSDDYLDELKRLQQQGVSTSSDPNQVGPDKDYEGLVDGDEFDGGDGQVGCVGDGKMALDNFEQVSVVKTDGSSQALRAAANSRDIKAANAWGRQAGTGEAYADELKKQGMVDLDEYGNDRLVARRQQLENWKNQQEIQASKRENRKLNEGGNMYGDDESDANWRELSASIPKTDNARLDGGEWQEATADADVKATFEMTGRLGQMASHHFEVDNEYNTFAPFRAAFTADSSNAFKVMPAEGTFNKRSQEPTEFTVQFSPQSYGDAVTGTLVIETEDFKHVYKLIGGTG